MVKFNDKTELAIDIGTNKIVCVLFNVTKNNKIQIIDWNQKKSSGIKKSRIVNIIEVSKNISEVVKRINFKNNFSDKVLSNISDLNLICNRNHNEINLGGFNVTKKEIRKLYKKSIQNSYLSNKKLIHSLPLKFNVDENFSISNPVGMSCQKLGLTSYHLSANLDIYENLKDCFKESSLSLKEVIDSSFASSVGCLNTLDKRDGSICIDIGGGSSKITTFYKGRLEFLDYIPLGGNDVTNDIENGLEISKELSEYIKIIYGDLEHSFEKKINIDMKNGQKKVISQNLLQGIIKPRYEEIFEIIRDKIDENPNIKVNINRVILTGGACQISGIKKLAKKIFNRNTSISSPTTNFFAFKGKPELSTIFGLMKIRADDKISKIMKIHNSGKVYSVIEKFDNWINDSFM